MFNPGLVGLSPSMGEARRGNVSPTSPKESGAGHWPTYLMAGPLSYLQLTSDGMSLSMYATVMNVNMNLYMCIGLTVAIMCVSLYTYMGSNVLFPYMPGTVKLQPGAVPIFWH